MKNKKIQNKIECFGIVINLILAIVAAGFLVGLEIEGVSGAIDSRGETPSLALNPGRSSSLNIEDLAKARAQANDEGARRITPENKIGDPDSPIYGGDGDGDGDSSLTSKLFGLVKPKKGMPGMFQAVGWASAAYFATGFLGKQLGLEEPTVAALQKGISAGIFTGYGINALFTTGGKEGLLASSGGFVGAHPWLIGAGVGAVVFVLTYKKVSYETVNFYCQPWEAPIGGEDCEKCNDGIHPCSEYRCKSLGQACGLVNEGTEQEMCVWMNPRDVSSPLITPWEDVLTENYRYTDTTPRPPAWGTTIVRNNEGCVEAFTPIEFGIQTNKPSQCKVDFVLTEGFDEMQYYLGENNLHLYNHSQKMNLPNPRAIDSFAESEGNETTGGLEIENDGNYNLYVRCSSANGYYNTEPYVIKFCVDDGPDLTPPLIDSTSIRNGQPVQYEVDEVPIEVYTNEPANCKWSRDNDQSFEDMPNEMECPDDIRDMNDDLLYTCSTSLTGIQDREENKFYFRCEDQPWVDKADRNKMSEGYEFTLQGTQPLNIKEGSVKPESGTRVTGATSTVVLDLEVETENGYDNGAAECFYSLDNERFVSFLETGGHEHTQQQELVAGEYTYYLKCVDEGGNQATAETTFEVFVDDKAPEVVRVLYESGNLKLITDEDSECRYSNDAEVQCNFDLNVGDGNPMPHDPSSAENFHLASWDPSKTYYVKCADENGKQPNPTQCSVVVKPVE